MDYELWIMDGITIQNLKFGIENLAFSIKYPASIIHNP